MNHCLLIILSISHL